MVTVEALPDYYLILGVPRHTNSEGIRRAFLRKARQYHPDLHPDDPECCSKMGAINIAYGTLSDPERRNKYDARRSEVSIRLPHVDTGPYVVAQSRQRHRVNREPGVFDTALAIFMRFFRYVSATLPP